MTKHTIHTYPHVPGDISDCKYTYGCLYIQAEGHINHRQSEYKCEPVVQDSMQSNSKHTAVHTCTDTCGIHVNTHTDYRKPGREEILKHHAGRIEYGWEIC